MSSSNYITSQALHRHVTSSPSTNSELLTAVRAGDIDASLPYMLTADMQTSGRGQHGRTWQSPKGNVYLSLYHPMNTPISGMLSLVVGYHLTQLPIIQAINRHRRQQNCPTIGVKWANDIGFYDTIKDDGQDKLLFNKLAGILIEPVLQENRLIGVVVGVGINVDSVPVLTQKTAEGMDYRAIGINELLKTAKDTIDTVSQQATGQDASSQTSYNLTPSDLYLPIRRTLMQAIKRFSAFAIDPYTVHQFVSDYANVNVLTHHQVIIRQQITSFDNRNSPDNSSSQNDTTKVKETLLKGEIVGINPNGSLQMAQSTDNNEYKKTETKEVIDIYTGTISVLA